MESSMRHVTPSLLALLLALPVHSGCLGSRCGPDEQLDQRECVPFEEETDGAAPDARVEGSVGDAGDAGSRDAVAFGTECTVDPECVGLDQCAIPPGKTVGYCTIECDPALEECPEGWFCFDLSVFDPDMPAICAEM
jgi:hypothetical protein